jgi:hypothetical protein
VACDVLWSDPVMQEGLRENEARGGTGCIFGPDVTEVCRPGAAFAMQPLLHGSALSVPPAARDSCGAWPGLLPLNHYLESQSACSP